MANFINKPKILYLMAGHPSIFGGGKRVFLQIMTHLDNNTFKFYSCCALNQEQEEILSRKGGIIIHIDIQHGGIFIPLIKLVKLLKKEKIDVIHSQGSRADFYARIAAKLAGHRIKVVNTVAMPVEGYDVGPVKRCFYRALDRFSERFVDRFLVVSSALEKTMIQGHGILREKVFKIYNGIETDDFNPEHQDEGRRRMRLNYSIPDEDILIGACGQLVWQKGFEYFIRSMPDIIKVLPKARFMIVGDGPLRKELEDIAISLGVRDRLIFTGYRGDIKDLLSAMDTVVIPSVLEGFPMITLEAMAMAKPIIATAIEGIIEQISDGKEGLLVAPRNPAAIAHAVKCLADDPIYAVSLGKNARTKVLRDFSVQKMIAETIKIYEAV